MIPFTFPRPSWSIHKSILVLILMQGTFKIFSPGVLEVGAAVPEYISNFANFTDHLIHILETSEPTEHKPGVHLYTPFSIGYLMANVYENLWPVPVREVPEAIFTLRRYVATDYAALLRLFKKRQFRVSSTIFTRFGNVSKPETFPQLLTQVISLDLQKNKTEFRDSLRQILDRGTRGYLDKEMLPDKEPAWREIFDNTTHGVYANTLYYKSEWDRPWKDIGNRKFFDNAPVPFLEVNGIYPYAETGNASAVRIKFQAATKEIVLFKPHDYTTVTDMRRIIIGMLNDESLWKQRNLTIQMPALNVTNLSQPSDKFQFIGVTDTFCRGRTLDPDQFYYNQHPIAHANHFEFNSEYMEIASTSGSLVSFQNNKDFLQKPPTPANETVKLQIDTVKESEADYFDILEAVEEEDERFQDYIIDARSGLPRSISKIKDYRGGGEYFRRVNSRKRANKSNNKKQVGTSTSTSSTAAPAAAPSLPVLDFEDCDPLQFLDGEEFGRSEMESSTDPSPSSTSRNGTAKEDIMEKDEMTTTLPPPPLITDENVFPGGGGGSEESPLTFVLDTPFSWILRDQEIGEVFYGSVSSLCQYNRAVHHIPTVPIWVLDLFKAFYWRCV